MRLQWQPSTKDDVSHSSGTVDISHVGHHMAVGARTHVGKVLDLGLRLLCQRSNVCKNYSPVPCQEAKEGSSSCLL